REARVVPVMCYRSPTSHARSNRRDVVKRPKARSVLAIVKVPPIGDTFVCPTRKLRFTCLKRAAASNLCLVDLRNLTAFSEGKAIHGWHGACSAGGHATRHALDYRRNRRAARCGADRRMLVPFRRAVQRARPRRGR